MKLNKDIIIYGVGSVASSLSSFVLLPFYIRKMSVEEFGVLSLTLIVPVFITSFMSLSLEGAVMRFYYEWKDKGVKYVENKRTKQQMPHHYQFYKILLKMRSA